MPFAVYASAKEQRIANVPIIKPLLIFILSGVKKIGSGNDVVCPAGTFVFLANSSTIDMRNIPEDEEYFAVLIEFDYSDFHQFKEKAGSKKKHFQGDINPVLEKALQQYLEWAIVSPSSALEFRKREILQLIYQMGYTEVRSIAEPPSISHQIYKIIHDNLSDDWSAERLAAHLAMSESTLRRRLKAEGSSVQLIKNRTKLGYALHLVQTSREHIGRISERCGYQSQSRFTHQFKQLFGVTPTELRKTLIKPSQ